MDQVVRKVLVVQEVQNLLSDQAFLPLPDLLSGQVNQRGLADRVVLWVQLALQHQFLLECQDFPEAPVDLGVRKVQQVLEVQCHL